MVTVTRERERGDKKTGIVIKIVSGGGKDTITRIRF